MEGNFEKQWREAFEDVSQEPPKIVWSEISNSLAADKVVVMQRQKRYYQIGIAAALLMSAFLGYSYFYSFQGVETTQMATTFDESRGSFSIPIYTPQLERTASTPANANVAAVSDTASEDQGLIGSDAIDEKWPDVINFDLLTTDLTIKSVELAVNFEEVKDHLYGKPKTYLRAGKSKEETRFWAGVDVASGSFDPNFQGGNTDLSSSLSVANNNFSSSSFSGNSVNEDSPPVKESMTSGTSLGLGMNVGLKLSDRWFVQSGIQYARSTATNSTNVVVETRQSVNPIAATSQFGRVSKVQEILNAEEVVSYEYKDVNLNNQFQFASIPLTTGYKVVDTRFSMAVNAGVSTNIYLGNKLSDPSNQVTEVTIGPGASSPYRQINFVGLAGVQLGYEIMEHFDLLIEPNYRHAINSATKSNADFVTNPSGLGLQTGIRYRFE